MRGVVPVVEARTGNIVDALERLLALGALPECRRCGEPVVVASEERIAEFPPVFEVGCRCTGCGLISRMRQVFDQLD